MPNLNLLLLNKVKEKRKKLNIPWKPTQTCIPVRAQLEPVIWQSFGPFLTGNPSENLTRYNVQTIEVGITVGTAWGIIVYLYPYST